MSFINRIKNNIPFFKGKNKAATSKSGAQPNPGIQDTVTGIAKYGLDTMNTPGLGTFKTYARAGKPYMKKIEEITTKTSNEGILARAALSASSEYGEYGAYKAAFNSISMGIHSPVAVLLAKTGLDAMSQQNLETYQNRDDAGKPFLEAIRKKTSSSSKEGIIARAALKTTGEAGKYAAYMTAFKAISNGINDPIELALAKIGLDAMDNRSFHYFNNGVNAAHYFLKAIEENTKANSFEGQLARVALKTNTETSSYVAYKSALKAMIAGQGNMSRIEVLAKTGLESLESPATKYFVDRAKSAHPFLKAIKETTKADSFEGMLARVALKTNTETSSYAAYQSALKVIIAGQGNMSKIEVLAKTGLEALENPAINHYIDGARAAHPFLKAINDNAPSNSIEASVVEMALITPPTSRAAYIAYKKALDKIAPPPPSKTPEKKLKKDKSSQPLNFLDHKHKDLKEGKKQGEHDKRIHIEENKVNIGGVELPRRKVNFLSKFFK